MLKFNWFQAYRQVGPCSNRYSRLDVQPCCCVRWRVISISSLDAGPFLMWIVLSVCFSSGSVSGGEKEEGPGAADFNRTHQKLGGRRHQNSGPSPPHVPGQSSHTELSGTPPVWNQTLKRDQHLWREFKSCFVFQESNECYLLLFPHTLLMVSVSLRMSGFIYQVCLLRPHSHLCTNIYSYRTSVINKH